MNSTPWAIWAMAFFMFTNTVISAMCLTELNRIKKRRVRRWLKAKSRYTPEGVSTVIVR